MTGFNFGAMVWEWGSLDLHDVLVAQRARPDAGAFADFDERAMTVAALDPESNSPRGACTYRALHWRVELRVVARCSPGGAEVGIDLPRRRVRSDSR